MVEIEKLLEQVFERLDTLPADPSLAARSELTELIDQLQAHLAGSQRGALVEFSELLARHHGAGCDPCISLEPAPESTRDSTSAALFEVLSESRPTAHRYRFLSEAGRGGMGVVLRVWDSHLRRSLALKLSNAASSGPGAGSSSSALSRFLEEAQIAAQLDHPGILPVHDLGVDAAGRPFFTMQLVRGRSLREVFEQLAGAGPEPDARAAPDEWTLTRAVGVLLRVSEAMAYAHSKGVLHRDLKPSNIMVGRFGEVYVMDWGLAKVQASASGRALEDGVQGEGVETARAQQRQLDPSAADRTLEGTIVGTPAYMAPEQARGQVDTLDERADVYALGAMLYTLLAGASPYAAQLKRGAHPAAAAIAGPPTPVGELAPEAPAELVAICERAMERDREQRYPDMQALGSDLRAWLEGRVVGAYEAGAWAELKKWIGRNRALTTAIAAGILVLVAGVVSSSVGFVRASQRADDVLRLSAIQDLETLTERSRQLWPAHPDQLTALGAWLDDADRLLEQRPELERRLQRLRARSRPPSEEQRQLVLRKHPLYEELLLARSDLAARQAETERMGSALTESERSIAEAWGERQQRIIAELEETIGDPAPWHFESSSDQWWHDRLTALIADLDGLADEQLGIAGTGIHRTLGPGVRRRVAMAERLRALDADPEVAARWQAARRSIADPAECPAYNGLDLAPQVGLVPLARDERSGLWEFWHVLSGQEPGRLTAGARAGELELDEASGLVLVLVPGGSFRMGSQRYDRSAANYDPYSSEPEHPVHEVRLDPFFLSKFETTQAQWSHLTDTRPSLYSPAHDRMQDGHLLTPLNPVEQVDWQRARTVLHWYGLALPTEAQWEHAARADTETAWWTGADYLTLEGAENIADRTNQRWYGALPMTADFEDGYLVHAPVDALQPNPWGFHHVLGNVTEWCEDRLGGYDLPYRPGTGERIVGPDQTLRCARGGSYIAAQDGARAARRLPYAPGGAMAIHGVRAARSLD